MTDAETVAAIRDLLMKARWEPPADTQQPFDRGYNLAMMQVYRALNGDKE